MEYPSVKLIEVEEENGDIFEIRRKNISIPDFDVNRKLFLPERALGELKGLGCFLDNDFYDWKIVKDREGKLVLLRLKKDSL